MGLTAFIVFVVPWMLFAAWLFTLPSAIRLGAPSAPWRPLTTGGRDWSHDQQREVARDNRDVRDGSGPAGGAKHEPMAMPEGGALRPSVEPTEPKE
jgi:hypothetical protein